MRQNDSVTLTVRARKGHSGRPGDEAIQRAREHKNCFENDFC